MNKVLGLLLSMAVIFSLQPVASAQDLYLVPSAVYTDDDEDWAVDDQLAGVQLGIGKFLNDNLAVEGVFGHSSLGGLNDLGLTEASVNGLLMFGRDWFVSPYLLAGAGGLLADSELSGNEILLHLNAGAGLHIGFGDSNVRVRLEHRYRMADGGGQSYTDRLTSLGVMVPFGRRASMPAPAPEPEPEADSDGDGVSDSNDNCPNTPQGHRVDSRGCSLDGDGDGVADADDACRNTVRGAEVDARGCELDDDGDGVVNREDQCPDTEEGVRVDVNGCEISDVIELPGVNFETNSDRLLPGADAVLRDAAATLRRYPELVVEVAGHTDSAGAAEYNQGLSERRALTVRDYLINAGASGQNVSARGYGETSPIADNETADGRARNRRVELRIVE